MIHLQGLRYHPPREDGYPFDLPLLQELRELHFSTPVTIFVGENGSGKSTLLEGMAALVGLPAIGGQPLRQDSSLVHAFRLAKCMKPIWPKRIQRGFFLRAEDFFGFVRSLEGMRRELQEELRESERLARERGASEYAVQQSASPWASQVASLQERYGTDLDAASHGESFMELLQARQVPQGLYLLDEPEAALSPMRQFALLAFLKDAVEEQGCQFVLATHSPILMAYPRAQILLFRAKGLEEAVYDDLEHVRFTRDFLRDKEAFLRHL